jgi:tetraacyldisaccharide 4'-kinase
VVERIAFADHHAYSNADADRLLALARRHEAGLVTTEKDYARLRGEDGRLAELAGAARALGIELAFEDRDLVRLQSLIEAATQNAGAHAQAEAPR